MGPESTAKYEFENDYKLETSTLRTVNNGILYCVTAVQKELIIRHKICTKVFYSKLLETLIYFDIIYE